MKTNANLWRTPPAGTEGTVCVYVDCQFGDDALGAGTRTNPYKSLQFASTGGRSAELTGTATKPSTMVVRGFCTENLTNFVDKQVIVSDYFGAFVYDGQSINELACHKMNNAIVRNSMSNVKNNSIGAGDNKNKGLGDNTIVINSVLNDGQISDSTKSVYARLLATDKIGIYQSDITGGFNRYNTFYSIGIDVINYINTYYASSVRGLFGKVAFSLYSSSWNKTFTECCFLADCEWYYTDQTTALKNKHLKIEAVQDDSVAEPTFTYENRDTALRYDKTYTNGVMVVRGAAIGTMYDALAALYAAGNLAVNPADKFIDCKWSSQTSEQCFVDVANDNYYLRPTSDAIISKDLVYGALEQAQQIAIVGTGESGSDGVVGCWDNRTLDGLLKVENAAISIDTASDATEGSIFTKIITTDPSKKQFNGIFTDYSSGLNYGWFANKNSLFGEKITTDNATLDPDSVYRVCGTSVTFNGTTYNAGDNIVTRTLTAEELTALPVAFSDSSCYLQHILDGNIYDALYVRCRSMLYGYATVGETLQKQITYINYGNSYIKFHGRVIVPQESFVCKNEESFQVCDADGVVDTTNTTYKIGVVFDDRDTIPAGEVRIGGKTEWIPAQAIGDYFALKSGGVIKETNIDQIGAVPAGCGNYSIFTDGGKGGTIIGTRTTMNQTYIQLGLFVKKVSEYNFNKSETE